MPTTRPVVSRFSPLVAALSLTWEKRAEMVGSEGLVTPEDCEQLMRDAARSDVGK